MVLWPDISSREPAPVRFIGLIVEYRANGRASHYPSSQRASVPFTWRFIVAHIIDDFIERMGKSSKFFRTHSHCNPQLQQYRLMGGRFLIMCNGMLYCIWGPSRVLKTLTGFRLPQQCGFITEIKLSCRDNHSLSIHLVRRNNVVLFNFGRMVFQTWESADCSGRWL